MGDIIKLRTARKQAERKLGQRVAASNRLRHGLSQAQCSLDRARATKARRDLDQHRIETGETSDEIASGKTLHRDRWSQDQR